MNKKFIYYFLIVVIVGALPITAQKIRTHLTPKEAAKTCPVDKKVCPDDTTVIRELPNCEFAICPIPAPLNSPLHTGIATSTKISTSTNLTATSTPAVAITKQKLAPAPANKPVTVVKPVTLISKIKAALSSAATTVTSPFKADPLPSGNPNDANIPASTYITKVEPQQPNTPVVTPLPPEDFAGQKYVVKGTDVLSNDNKVIYTIPPEVITAVSSSNSGWTNTTINVVPVGTAAPILNAIPIKDLPGKYYLSENSFGNIEACEFSNKIFILDTNTNTATLMYEENSSTLSVDDPRACNSEIFLLATEGTKLVIKYHTIGTNTLCDSAWSEPEKTFYLDVTKLSTEGMKKYTIPENLSATAEEEEAACRAKL